MTTQRIIFSSFLLGETLLLRDPALQQQGELFARDVVSDYYITAAGLSNKKPLTTFAPSGGVVAWRCDKMNDTRFPPTEQVFNSDVFAAEQHASRLIVVEVYPDVR